MTIPTESLAYLMPFGKHKGKPIGYVLNHEPTYLTVFLKRIELREPFNAHVKAALEFHTAGGQAEDPIINEHPEDPDIVPIPEGTVLDR